jgi:hypothetical protein
MDVNEHERLSNMNTDITWSYEGGPTGIGVSVAEVSNFFRSVCDWPVLYRSNLSYRKNTLFISSLILNNSSEK